MISLLKNTINTLIRFKNGLKRPSRQRNLDLLHKRGETIDSFVIREAKDYDVTALASLHVKTWNETYNGRGPGLQVREHQWRELFKDKERTWFVLVIENKKGELVGFAKGQPYHHHHLPGFNSELNKIYLLREYQRLGLGRKLVGQVARKLLESGMTNMVLFGTPQNPSSGFHETLGAERLHSKGEYSRAVIAGGTWRSWSLFAGYPKRKNPAMSIFILSFCNKT